MNAQAELDALRIRLRDALKLDPNPYTVFTDAQLIENVIRTERNREEAYESVARLSGLYDGGKENLVGFTSQEGFLKAKGISLSGGTSGGANSGRFPYLGIRWPNPTGKGHLLAIVRLFTEDAVDDSSRHRRSALADILRCYPKRYILGPSKPKQSTSR